MRFKLSRRPGCRRRAVLQNRVLIQVNVAACPTNQAAWMESDADDDNAFMRDDPDDLAECARAMVKRHGASARSVAKMFAHAHAKTGNAEMTAFWKAVTAAIQKASAAAH
jgi:hypothetical protein